MDGKQLQPWLSVLIERFIHTENYAKQELDLPLSVIFAHSEPRPKIAAPADDPSHEAVIHNDLNASPVRREVLMPSDQPASQSNRQRKSSLLPTLKVGIGKDNNIITEADNPEQP